MRLSFVTLFVFLHTVCGCGQVRNGTAESETQYRLKCWGAAIAVALQVGDDIRVYKDPSEFEIAWELKESGVVACVSKSYMLDDQWGRKFQLIVVTYNDAAKHVRVLSVGKNGVFEDGGGDDLYVDIRLEKGQEPVWIVNRE